MVVDFSKPLEAVHEDGRIGLVRPHAVPALPRMAYGGEAGVGYMDSWRGGWRRDGSPIGPNNKWAIRNTVTTPPIPAPIAERMRGLIERMAKHGAGLKPETTLYFTPKDFDEARAIMDELAPVDPDLLEARNVVFDDHVSSGNTNHDRSGLDSGKLDNERPIRIALAAIRKGRELEREGRK